MKKRKSVKKKVERLKELRSKEGRMRVERRNNEKV